MPGERYEAIAASMRGLHAPHPDLRAARARRRARSGVTRSARATGCAPTCPCCRGWRRTRPYWHGLDSGFASARAQLFRGLPRAVIPPAFAGWEEYEAYVAAWLAAGDAPDYTFLWWDVRPHPRLGTVELRAMDAQSRLASVAGLAALVHGLALALLDGRAEPPAARPGDRRELVPRRAATGWARRLRWGGAMRPLGELAAEALERRPRPRCASAAATARSRRSSGSCGRATAPTGCAPRTPRAGCASVLERLVAETAQAAAG